MQLSEKDKELVRAAWATVTGKEDELGAAALSRMMDLYPKARIVSILDRSPGSPEMKRVGKQVMDGFSDVVNNLDHSWDALARLRAQMDRLLVDGNSFQFLVDGILQSLKRRIQDAESSEEAAALMRFMQLVAGVLYR